MNRRTLPGIAVLALLPFSLLGCPVDLDLGVRADAADARLPSVDAARDGGSIVDSARDGDSAEDAWVYSGPRRVFVTSELVSPDFSQPNDRHAAEPLARADAKCVQFARKAGLGGDWKAWLFGAYGTGEEIQAIDHANAKKGPYVLVDGKTVVFPGANAEDHASTAISMTELGTFVPAGDLAWVGSFGKACDRIVDGKLLSWAEATGSSQGSVGKATDGTFWGTAAGQSRPCNIQAHLYCFEQ